MSAKIALEKERIQTAVKIGLRTHYDDLKQCSISDEHIDTLFHLFTVSIMDAVEESFLKWGQ